MGMGEARVGTRDFSPNSTSTKWLSCRPSLCYIPVSMLTPFLCHRTSAAGLASVTSQVRVISFPVRISNTSRRGDRADDVTVTETGFTGGRGAIWCDVIHMQCIVPKNDSLKENRKKLQLIVSYWAVLKVVLKFSWVSTLQYDCL